MKLTDILDVTESEPFSLAELFELPGVEIWSCKFGSPYSLEEFVETFRLDELADLTIDHIDIGRAAVEGGGVVLKIWLDD